MALFKALEPHLSRSARWMKKEENCAAIFRALGGDANPVPNERLVSISKLEASPRIRATLTEAYRKIEHWFKPVTQY